MKSSYSWYQTRYLVLAFSALVALFLYSLWDRVPDIDDAWIGEHAYWLVKDGHVHSELMRGITHQENISLAYHKLFIFNGALAIKIFGFHLYSLKGVSLFYFIIFLILYYDYTCKWRKLFNGNDLLLALIILLSFPWVFKNAYLYRPETMLMALGFAGFILLENYLKDEKGKSWKLLLSGILFGSAMLAHLNGLILAAAGFFLLIWNKKYRSLWVYGTGVLAAFSIYFYDMTNIQALELWKEQFFNAPSFDINTRHNIWLKPLFNLLNEHMRYFHNLQSIVFSIFIFVTLITGFKFLYNNHKNLVRFALLIAIFTGVLAVHKTVKYMLINLPYIVLLITLTLKAINEGKINHFKIGKPGLVRYLLFLFFILFLVVSIRSDVLLSMQKFSQEQNRKLAEKYAGGKAKNMKIIAPMTFIFNEIKDFNQIQGQVCYTELQKSDSTIYGKGFLEKANEFDRDLIMVTPYYQRKLGIESFQKGDEFKHYRVIDKNGNMIVLKRKTATGEQN